jgi:hypothetical protein
MNISKLNLNDAIENATSTGMTCFGIRHHHTSAQVGDKTGNSYNQIDDEENYELQGICAIEFNPSNCEDAFSEEVEYCMNILKDARYQDGDIIMVAGNNGEYGHDDGEIVIPFAEVIFVF